MTDATLETKEKNQSRSKEDIDVLIKSFPDCKPCDMAHKDATSGEWDPNDEFNLKVEKKEYTGADPDRPTLAPEITIQSKCKVTKITGYLSPEDMTEYLKSVSCKKIEVVDTEI